jgi:hypothetical protein
MGLRIDRDRFLLLVSALGAVGCTEHDRSSMFGHLVAADPAAPAPPPPGAPQPVGPPQGPLPPGAAQPVAAPSVKTAAPVQGPRPAVAASAPPHAEDTPTVVCGDLLAGGKIYRPRAARAAAACMSRMGAKACDISVRNRCYNEGVHAACPEAQFASVCQTKMDQCKAAGKPITYTKEECMKAASALTGGDRTWALGAMGPTAEGSCKLMFTVL